MSVSITIKMASLKSDILVKSFMNTARVKDPADQYAVRAGEENSKEVDQCLQDAFSSLKAVCRPFLATTNDTAGNDALDANIGVTDQTLTFDVTVRRTANFADALAQAMHQYLVNASLRRFYTTAMMPDLVSAYTAGEAEAYNTIKGLLYRKAEPIYT